MVSKKFNVYRYRYESDSSDTFIREHRIQVNPANNNEIVPVTGIFLSFVVSLPNDQKKIKAEKLNTKERLATVTYKNLDNVVTTTDRYIPSNNSVIIRNQLIEQGNYDNVLCLEYKGETRDYQLSKFI